MTTQQSSFKCELLFFFDIFWLYLQHTGLNQMMNRSKQNLNIDDGSMYA